MIKVKKNGIDVTIQDKGRPGFYSIAMPPSGALDEYSFVAANLLVGNDENSALLEITYLGPTLEFQSDYWIAITGGEMPPKLNGESIPMWESVKVKSGDVLSFDFIKNGARTYVAISGGIDVPIVMGSRSTYKSIGLGGFKGRSLKEGDILEVKSLEIIPLKKRNILSKELRPKYKKFYEVNAVLGMCSYRFTPESINNFFECEWTVTPEADRVGYRLKGIKLEFEERKQPFGAGSNPSNIVDSGYPIGSIQIPNGTEPIVLLKDAVTCGGFVTIGATVSTEVNKIAQIKTGEKIKFNCVSIHEALEIRKDYYRQLDKLRDAILT